MELGYSQAGQHETILNLGNMELGYSAQAKSEWNHSNFIQPRGAAGTCLWMYVEIVLFDSQSVWGMGAESVEDFPQTAQQQVQSFRGWGKRVWGLSLKLPRRTCRVLEDRDRGCCGFP